MALSSAEVSDAYSQSEYRCKGPRMHTIAPAMQMGTPRPLAFSCDDSLCSITSVLGGEDNAESKFEQRSFHDAQMFSPSAQREVSGSLGRQLWIKQKETALGKV